jgi:hypothetical protein
VRKTGVMNIVSRIVKKRLSIIGKKVNFHCAFVSVIAVHARISAHPIIVDTRIRVRVCSEFGASFIHKPYGPIISTKLTGNS